MIRYRLSDFIIKTSKDMLEGPLKKGNFFYGGNIVEDMIFDKEECIRILSELSINYENVLKYLNCKYKPCYVSNGVIFPNKKCIQNGIITGNSLLINIKNSEPHKIITDTFYIIDLLKRKDLDFDEDIISFRIDNLKMKYEDCLMYSEFLKSKGEILDSIVNIHVNNILSKYPTFKDILKIKKKSIKRKYLRYCVQRKLITMEDLLMIIPERDFSDKAIDKLMGKTSTQKDFKIHNN